MADDVMAPKDACRAAFPAAIYEKIERNCPDADWNGIMAIFQTNGSAGISALKGALDLFFPEANRDR